jgi:hypothetical protein
MEQKTDSLSHSGHAAGGHAAEALARELIARYQAGLSRQSNWQSLWDGAAKYILQNRRDGIVSRTPPGLPQTVGIYDRTATESAGIMAAGMLTHSAPAGEIWFLLRPAAGMRFGGRDLSGETGPDGFWLQSCSGVMSDVIAGSNFYENVFEALMDAAGFSLGAVFVDEIDRADGGMEADVVNFIHVPCGTYTVEEDFRGRVNTMFRKFEWTARQAAERFGEAALGDAMRKCLGAGGDADRRFPILHACYPRTGREEVRRGRADGKYRPYASVYIDLETNGVMHVGGYYEQPFAVFRLLRGNNEIYGRGPADHALPLIERLNELVSSMHCATRRLAEPGWMMPDDSSYVPDNRPNGITYWSAANPNNKPERLVEQGRWDWVAEFVEGLRAQIRSAFYVDMFQLLNNPEVRMREKTAYEVQRMLEEKLVLFSPIFGRMKSEFLDPLLRRVFGICLRSGLFEVPPDGLDVVDYKVDYVSKIALAIRSAASSSLMTMAQVAGQLGQLEPAVGQIIKWEEGARTIAANLGVPVRLQRSTEELEEIRRQQQQAAAAAQMLQLAQTAKAGAGAAKDLGPDAQISALEALKSNY